MFKHYEVGEVICDMHDGIKLPDCFELESEIKVASTAGSKFIEDTVRDEIADKYWAYRNKLLVVLDYGNGYYKCGYSWDGRYLALIKLKVKAKPENDRKSL